MTLLIVLVVVLSYLLGSIPFGLIVARSQGVDLRQHGSGNIGATNVWRVMGKKWGLITFFADLLKGVVAVKLGLFIGRLWQLREALPRGKSQLVPLDPDLLGYVGIAAAVACIIGHNFPVWLRFRGGKGVATSLGVIFGMAPLPALIVFGIWALVFKTSRYVSLASIIAAVCLPLVVIAFLIFGGLQSWAHFYFSVVAALMVVKRHQPNIARLVAGTELRFGAKKDAAAADPVAAGASPAASITPAAAPGTPPPPVPPAA